MKIIKVPFSEAGLGKTDGAEKAPDEILVHLNEMHLNESYQRVQKYDIREVEIESSNISANNQKITDAAAKEAKHALESKEKIIILGGNHAITYAAFKGFAKHNKDAGLVVIDAHPDVLPEVGVQSHEDWLRLLIDEGTIRPDKVVIAGIRNTDNTEKDFLDMHKIKAYTMKHIYENTMYDFCDGLMETIREWPCFYLSVDIDAADPSCAPGTGYPEPGGFSARELIYIIQRLSRLKGMSIMDIVEVNPEKDINCITSKLAAKLIKETE